MIQLAGYAGPRIPDAVLFTKHKLEDDMKKSYDMVAGVWTFEAEDGTKQTLNESALSDEIKRQAMFHGISQKIGDAYAGAGKATDPEAYAKEAVAETIAQLTTNGGTWKAAGGGGTRYGFLVQAVALVSGKPLEEVATLVKAMSEKEQKELQAKPKVKMAIAKLKIERQMEEFKAAEAAAAKEDAAAKAEPEAVQG
jgi:hypothetical protein